MSADESDKKTGCLPPCAICHSQVAIYRCPRCHTFTCSLACCQVHKAGGGGEKTTSSTTNGVVAVCNGKRDRTHFCSLKGFTDSQLASDYHFLEDVLKVSESSKRLYHGIVTNNDSNSSTSKQHHGVTKKRPRIELDSISSEIPIHPLLQAKERKSLAQVIAHGAMDDEGQPEQQTHPNNGIVNQLLGNKPTPNQLHKSQSKGTERFDPLIRHAGMKGITLLRMPSGMQRHQSNTTRFAKKTGLITWKIELCFHSHNQTLANESLERAQDESSSTTTIKTALPKILKVESELVESSTLSTELAKHLNKHLSNTTIHSALRYFAPAPRESLVLLMKRLPCSYASPQYYKLDPNVPLLEILDGKTIIEYPTIEVILDEDVGYYPLFIGQLS